MGGRGLKWIQEFIRISLMASEVIERMEFQWPVSFISMRVMVESPQDKGYLLAVNRYVLFIDDWRRTKGGNSD